MRTLPAWPGYLGWTALGCMVLGAFMFAAGGLTFFARSVRGSRRPTPSADPSPESPATARSGEETSTHPGGQP